MLNDMDCDLKLLQPMEQPLGKKVFMSTEEYHQLQQGGRGEGVSI